MPQAVDLHALSMGWKRGNVYQKLVISEGGGVPTLMTPELKPGQTRGETSLLQLFSFSEILWYIVPYTGGKACKKALSCSKFQKSYFKQ